MFWSLVPTRLLIKATFSTDICGPFVKKKKITVFLPQLNHAVVCELPRVLSTFRFLNLRLLSSWLCPWKSNMFCRGYVLFVTWMSFLTWLELVEVRVRNKDEQDKKESKKSRAEQRARQMCFLLVRSCFSSEKNMSIVFRTSECLQAWLSKWFRNSLSIGTERESNISFKKL